MPRGSLLCPCPSQRWAAPSAATRALAARSAAQTGTRLSRCEQAGACSAGSNVLEVLLHLGRPLQAVKSCCWCCALPSGEDPAAVGTQLLELVVMQSGACQACSARSVRPALTVCCASGCRPTRSWQPAGASLPQQQGLPEIPQQTMRLRHCQRTSGDGHPSGPQWGCLPQSILPGRCRLPLKGPAVTGNLVAPGVQLLSRQSRPTWRQRRAQPHLRG